MKEGMLDETWGWALLQLADARILRLQHEVESLRNENIALRLRIERLTESLREGQVADFDDYVED